MSRSFKKFPYWGDKKTVGKKLANKAVRNGKYKDYDIPEGSWYKNIYNRWGVCDFYNTYTWEEFQEWNLNHRWSWFRRTKETEKELYRRWYKTYKAK